ncbi:MAG: FAD-binding oxidoreductase, partial [Acidimicrobiales bacterium]
IALSTVGGWLACRGAGQLSNRYGKIEDMVLGLEVVLASGQVVATGGYARSATGPDLNQLFVGSEGTFGIITSAELHIHRTPAHRTKSAWGFDSFAAANEAVRRIIQRGARTAVLRVNDKDESARTYDTGDLHLLIAMDEGDPEIVDAAMRVVEQECADAEDLGEGLVNQWLEHRNDVAGLEALTQRHYVVDTMEVSVPWSAVGRAYDEVRAALLNVDGIDIATAHQSHAYSDSACLYFTFAGKPDAARIQETYIAAWDAGTRAALAVGASLSHHHGVGLNRGRFMAEALGEGFEVLQTLKQALDPNGILNPGKLGLGHGFGEVPFP